MSSTDAEFRSNRKQLQLFSTGNRGASQLWDLHEELIQEIQQRKRLHPKKIDEEHKKKVVEEHKKKVEVGHKATSKGSSIELDLAKASRDKLMNIVMVGSECAPYSKTGGLADVMGSLPKALAARGHRVMVVSPKYKDYMSVQDTGCRLRSNVFNQDQEVGYFHEHRDGVDYVLVDHSCYRNRGKELYGGSRFENEFRNALLCKSALEAPLRVPCNGEIYGDSDLVYVANDWHAGLIPVYLQALYRDNNKLHYARSVLVLHNIIYQGRGAMDELDKYGVPEDYMESFRLDDPIGGEHMNVLKAAITHAHRVVAVSTGYAWECQTMDGGWGLHEVLKESDWKLRGIVNGIDTQEWNPLRDEYLTGKYCRYSFRTLERGKRKCKKALQQEMSLPQDPERPLLGFIGRLDYQKGVDLIQENYEWLMSQGAQLVMLGSGRSELEKALRDMEIKNQDQCRGWVGFSPEMAHKITAASDILLMPSRFEPCGLNQLYAMAYGTVPVVHGVGGLNDTVEHFNPYANTGTGWKFDDAVPSSLKDAVGHALLTYKDYPDSFREIQRRGMLQDFSWGQAAKQYEEVLLDAKYQW